MKVTFSKLLELNGQLNKMFADPKFENTKFGYAAKKFVNKNLTGIFNEYNDQLESCRVSNALTDENTKEILFNEKGEYKFSKEGILNFMKEKKDIISNWENKEFDIEPYFSTEVPDLTDERSDLFKGILVE